MSKCQAEIVGVLSGTVASAATMIALHCDKLEIAEYTAFMIHSASGGISGKSHETKAYMEFNDILLKELFNKIYIKDSLVIQRLKKYLMAKTCGWEGQKWKNDSLK